jgi:hypothetical protein
MSVVVMLGLAFMANLMSKLLSLSLLQIAFLRLR